MVGFEVVGTDANFGHGRRIAGLDVVNPLMGSDKAKGGRASPTGTLTNGLIKRAASNRIGDLPELPRGVRLIMVGLPMLGAGCAAHE